MMGNSRLHWAYFMGEELAHTWDTPHLSPNMLATASDELIHLPIFESISLDLRELLQSSSSRISVWGASVVPIQTELWRSCQSKIDFPLNLIQLHQLPLLGLYPSMGVDRGLALWGAQVTRGWPSLVIDAGTALTLSATDAKQFVGGAILPGVGLQFRILHGETATLPDIGLADVGLARDVPRLKRWAKNTPDAILSGVLHTLLAGLREYINHWLTQYPYGSIVLTGGDSALLHPLLQEQDPGLGDRLYRDPNLIFWGIGAYQSFESQRLGNRSDPV